LRVHISGCRECPFARKQGLPALRHRKVTKKDIKNIKRNSVRINKQVKKIHIESKTNSKNSQIDASQNRSRLRALIRGPPIRIATEALAGLTQQLGGGPVELRPKP
jgi:hypothetical protein